MQNVTTYIQTILILLPPFLIALTVHEFSHAAMATFLGDPTAKRLGRLTLNPLKHIDPIGLVCLFLFRIGWAKPVPFDPRYFKHPRTHAVLTAFAGPLSNFVVVFISHMIIAYTQPVGFFLLILQFTAYINTMLGVFNVVPIPPLDGSHLLDALLIDKIPKVIWWLRRYSIFIILLLFYLPQVRMTFINAILITDQFIASLVP